MKTIFTKALGLLGASMLMLVTSTLAQPTVGIHLQFSPVISDAADLSMRRGIGVSTEFFSRDLLSDSPIRGFIGAHLDIMGLGNEKRGVSLNGSQTHDATLIIRNSQIGFNGIWRLMTPKQTRIQPYVDLLAGFSVFLVEEELREGGWLDCDEHDNQVINTSWRPRVGAGVGTMIRVSEGVNLDFRATYIHVNQPNIADLQTVERVENEIRYGIDRIRIQPWNLQFGLNFDIHSSFLRCTPSRDNVSEVNTSL